MARARKNQTKVCTVTGVETNVNNFYKNHFFLFLAIHYGKKRFLITNYLIGWAPTIQIN